MKRNIHLTIVGLLSSFFIGHSNHSIINIKDQIVNIDGVQNSFQDTTEMGAQSVWRRTSWYLGGTPAEIIEIFVDRDTVIDNRLCRILKTKFDNQIIEDSDLPIYYKEGKMFFYEDDQWLLLYDFTANQGDTVTFYLSNKTSLYTSGRIDFTPVGTNPYQIIIDSVDHVVASDGRSLRRFFTSDGKLGGSNVYGMYEIIEDIGSTFGIFGHYYIFTAEDWRYQFLCYKNEWYVYPDEISCTPSTSDNTQKETIRFNPNPVNDFIQITWENQSSKERTIEVYNTQGKLLNSEPIHASGYYLDLKSYPSGLLIIAITEDGKIIHSTKIIKQ